ncbi:hypothetical protein KKE60_05505 [Patescibacteria group bacterium]|nr:hypothetical protein [Patescibacteria group bacterium]
MTKIREIIGVREDAWEAAFVIIVICIAFSVLSMTIGAIIYYVDKSSNDLTREMAEKGYVQKQNKIEGYGPEMIWVKDEKDR